MSEFGKEAIVGIFHGDQFFGVACLGTVKLRTATVVTMEECLITAVKKQAMLSALDSEPLLSAFFHDPSGIKKCRLEEDMIDQLLNSSERRLARLLLVLAGPYHEGRKPILVTLSQEVLAEMVGTTRSRVSTFMNEFRDEGLISYDSHSRRIEVYPAQLLSLLGS